MRDMIMLGLEYGVVFLGSGFYSSECEERGTSVFNSNKFKILKSYKPKFINKRDTQIKISVKNTHRLIGDPH